MAEIVKLGIGGAVYDLKDAVARAALDKIGTAERPLACPFYVVKDGVKYSCDIIDDAEGIDFILTKQTEET